MLTDRDAQRWWNQFAKRDPYYFSHPGLSPEAYDRAGEETVRDLLEAHATNSGRNRALEIGSGMGRLTLPLARRFAHVTALDISDAYLSILRSRADEAGVRNIETMTVDGPWQRAEAYDLVLTIYALQHVRSWSTIAEYIAILPTVLTQSGIAIMQFDTRRQTAGYHLRSRLPGALAPRQLKPGYRRIRRSPDALRRAFDSAHLDLVHHEGEGTNFTLYVLHRR
jgi:cyclopropane fatty-acyl-phospholipid synthase-like methyltransferase